MVGIVPSGWMRRILLLLVLITGAFLIAMFANAPPLASLQPFTAHRTFQSPWSWVCVDERCERRAVRSSKNSWATCIATCGGNDRLLWPMPTGKTILGEKTVMLHLQQIELITVDTNDQEIKNLLEHAKEVFLENIRSLIKVPNAKARSSIDNFSIYITAGNAKGVKLTQSTDESYRLDLSLKGKVLEARIIGKSYYGVRHGLETLSQMIWWDNTAGRQGMLRTLTKAKIEDRPSFYYRGLLIDTGRQFFSIDELKKVIDGMAASKLNTFHWHLTDSQSFPFDSPTFPEMARWGAYSGEQIYTTADIRDLVVYARIRGIRIIIEIDSPAHAGAGWQWGSQHGLGELAVCVDQQPWSQFCGEPNCGQLNPINEHTYRILEGLYKEILDLTEVRDIIHLGGDEVNLDCWAQNSNITIAMQAQNKTDYCSLWGEYEIKLLQRIVRINNNEVPEAVVLWSSALTKKPYINTYLDPKVHVIQTWGSSAWQETEGLLDNGFRVILSHVNAWYMDCGFGKWRETGEAACNEYRTWQTVYSHKPWQEYPQEQLHLILGAEVAIWSEQTGQASLGPRLWPRTSAFAERIWSDLPSNGHSVDENVYTRLSAHMGILEARRLKIGTMWPHWCTLNPGKCL